ncbi:hypothetical protein T12_11650, partial [Trichinella patagoniensis]
LACTGAEDGSSDLTIVFCSATDLSDADVLGELAVTGFPSVVFPRCGLVLLGPVFLLLVFALAVLLDRQIFVVLVFILLGREVFVALVFLV